MHLHPEHWFERNGGLAVIIVWGLSILCILVMLYLGIKY